MNVTKPLETSPFSQTNFHNFGTYTKRGSHMGLRLPDGKILINFNDGSSYGMLKNVADVTNSDIVTVKGTWVFTPDPIEEDDEDAT